MRVGGPGRQDHPYDLIQTLKAFPTPIDSRAGVVDYLVEGGFSVPVARYVFRYVFDISI